MIEEAEAQCAKEALLPKIARTETDIQKKMRTLLFDKAFSSSAKSETPPISSDWKHLPTNTKSIAAYTYSLIPWKEYSFYTPDGVYYHNKKKGIHEFLYYDNINNFDSASGVVDYGKDHSNRDILKWPNREKNFIKQISHLREFNSESDTSIFEFCFNAGNIDFQNSVFQKALKTHCQGKNDIIRQNLDHIKVASMQDGMVNLQFSMYFPRVETITISEDDDEYERERKEWEQEKLIWEAEELERKAWKTQEKLVALNNDISEIFRLSIYERYGVLYANEKIILLKDPDFTYGRPSTLEKLCSTVDNVNSAAESFMGFANDYVDKHNLRK